MSDLSSTASQTEFSLGSQVRDGLKDAVPILIAAPVFGFVFGGLAVQKGLTPLEAVSMSAGMFAGASQIAAVDLWSVSLQFWTIVLSVLAINFRHVLYSAALSRRMNNFSAFQRYAAYFLMADPLYAFAERRAEQGLLSPAYYFAIALSIYVLWILSTLAGIFIGSQFDEPEKFGIDFAVIAYFILILFSFRRRPMALTVMTVSATSAMIAYWTLGPPWHIAAGAVFGVGTATIFGGQSGSGGKVVQS